VPMLPNVAGPDATRLQIWLYTLVLVPVGVLPAFMGFGGAAYAWFPPLRGLAWWRSPGGSTGCARATRP